MKQSIVTGKYIYEEIKRIEDEALEIEKGLDTIYDEIGTDSIAYTLLKDQYENKRKELNQLFKNEYEQV